MKWYTDSLHCSSLSVNIWRLKALEGIEAIISQQKDEAIYKELYMYNIQSKRKTF